MHPALQGHGARPAYSSLPSITACTAGTAAAITSGTLDTAGMQDCRPSSTAGTPGAPGMLPVQHCRAAGNCRATGRCGDAGLPPLQHCRAQGTAVAGAEQHCPCCTASTVALPASHCQVQRHHPPGTAGMQGPEPHPSCAACGAVPPPVSQQSEGHGVPAQAALQCRKPRAASGSAQPRLTATAAQHPPRCTVTRQPHTLRQQLLFPSSLQTHCSFPFLPLQSGTWHALGAHPVPVPTSLLQRSAGSTAPLHCRDTPALLHPCTAAPLPPHTAAPLHPCPHHWHLFPMPTYCPGHASPTGCPLLCQATCPATKPLSGAALGHQLSCSILGTHFPPPGSRSFC